MTIFYTIFLYYLAVRIFVKNQTRKNIFIAITLVTVISLIPEIPYIIVNPSYILVGCWQTFVAYILGLIYTFYGTISIRKMKFKHNSKSKEEIITTTKGKSIFYIVLSVVMIILGSVPLAFYIKNNESYLLSLIILPYVIAVGLIALLIKMFITKKDEYFILVTDICNVKKLYIKEINSNKFNYKDYVGELSKLYFIYNVGKFNITGDIKQTHYVYILSLNDEVNIDIDLEESNTFDPNFYISIYNNKQTKRNVVSQNNTLKLK